MLAITSSLSSVVDYDLVTEFAREHHSDEFLDVMPKVVVLTLSER